MTRDQGPPPRLLAIWTRDPGASRATGRGQLAGAIRAILDEGFAVQHLQLRHALDPALPHGRRRLLREAPGSLFGRQRLPTQCLLYLPGSQAASLAAAARAADPAIIYLDGIRAAPFLPALRAACPKARIVLDMDDLMSRRWREWRRAGIGLTLGFIERYLPAGLLRLAAGGPHARLFQRFETAALRRVEREVAGSADLVAFTSEHEAALYRRLLARQRRPAPALAAINPPVPAVAPVRWEGRGRLRFAFVGTDQIPQNWLTIDYLVALWQRLRPSAELVLVGRLQRRYPDVPGVVRAGFVADLKDVYTPDTVLLAPAFIRGGIKTKVAEAFAHGCPVLGNAATFDGMSLPRAYPLRLPLAGLEAIVADPGSAGERFAAAAGIGRAYVEGTFGEDLFRQRWVAALTGAAPPGPEGGATSVQEAAAALSP
jgi:hypothetical protein